MSIRDNWKKNPESKAKGRRRYTVRYRDEDGRSREKSFDLKKDAENFEADTRRAKDRGESVAKLADVTATELWGANGHEAEPVEGSFLHMVKIEGVRGGSGASPKTLTKYRNCFRLYIEPQWGSSRLDGITHDAVAKWIRSLRSASTGKSASDYLKRETTGIFRSFMDYALAEGYVSSNPALDRAGRMKYRPASVKQKEHVYLTMAQLGMLAKHCDGFSSLIWTAGLGGLRFGELTALTVSDLELGEKPLIRVTKAYTDDRGTLHLKGTKTGEDRTVPLPRLIADMLKVELEGRSPVERVWSAPRSGGVIRHGSFTKAGSRFAKAVEGATAEAEANGEKFPQLTFHDLRHTAVSLAIKAGANVKVVQQIAGHSSATITLDTYAGLFTEDLHDSAARLNAEMAKVWGQ